jgi:hypothetical protein
MYFCVTYLLAIKHEKFDTTTLLLVTLLLVFFTSCKRDANHDLAEVTTSRKL